MHDGIDSFSASYWEDSKPPFRVFPNIFYPSPSTFLLSSLFMSSRSEEPITKCFLISLIRYVYILHEVQSADERGDP